MASKDSKGSGKGREKGFPQNNKIKVPKAVEKVSNNGAWTKVLGKMK